MKTNPLMKLTSDAAFSMRAKSYYIYIVMLFREDPHELNQ
jgi:hypothetical protein